MLRESGKVNSADLSLKTTSPTLQRIKVDFRRFLKKKRSPGNITARQTLDFNTILTKTVEATSRRRR